MYKRDSDDLFSTGIVYRSNYTSHNSTNLWVVAYLLSLGWLTLGACARVTVVILCVCLSVCYRPSADIRRVCDKIGLPVYSSLHAKGFKLSVFAKKPSISSSSLFSLRTAERAAILKHWSCYVDFNDHYQQLSMFDDCVQRIRRPLPHATTITRGGKYSYMYSTLYIRCLVAIWVGVLLERLNGLMIPRCLSGIRVIQHS